MDPAWLIKRFIPEDTWLGRTFLLLGFIFLDFMTTASLCKTPLAEANPYARFFMQRYGILEGLIFFNLLATLPIYAVLVFDSHLIKQTKHYRAKTELVIDIALAWLVAGVRFNGAMSWLWDAPNLLRQAMGSAIYLAIAVPLFHLFPRTLSNARFFALKRNKKVIC
ncbi:hypothetical protein DRO35_04225 [Candidatus Bathyarchaeota archaeon]|nr:MAG: hypothetical protein DRO35_04225 [Candidatus Bathyarchaeota archaeon]